MYGGNAHAKAGSQLFSRWQILAGLNGSFQNHMAELLGDTVY
jgi:hypothetical protein